jgi:hypothetical protein
MIADCFEQADFPVADRLSRPEIKTQSEPRHTASLAEAVGKRTTTLNRGGKLTVGYAGLTLTCLVPYDSDVSFEIYR